MPECWFLVTLILCLVLSHPPASSTYTIDNQTPISFPVPSTSKIRYCSKSSNCLPDNTSSWLHILAKAPRCPLISTTLFSRMHHKHSYFQQHFSSCNFTLSSSTTIHRKPTEAIIGGVIGRLILISLHLALSFNRRRNNRRSQAQRARQCPFSWCRDPFHSHLRIQLPLS